MRSEKYPVKETEQLLETEIRVILSQQQREEITDKLTGMGAEFIKSHKVTDVYYCSQSVTSFSDLEMNEVGSYSIRIRETEENGETSIDWNIKQITEEADHAAWAEYEVKLSSMDMADKMLRIMAFKPFIKIEKDRKIYSIKDKAKRAFTLLIEDITDFGPVLEIETFSRRKDVEKSKQSIYDLIEQAGMSTDQIVPKSVTNLIMRQKAFK